MAPSQAIPILGQMEETSARVFHLWSHGGCHIWPRAPGLISIMAQGITRGPQPQRLFESNSNNGPSMGQSNLGQMEDTSVKLSH